MTELAKMKLLINLARIDGKVAEREQNYIINIGRANGIYPDEVRPLFEQDHALFIPQNLSDDERFNYIFSVVQLMKIDERMYKEEISFCGEVATTLGYDREVLLELLLHVKSSSMTEDDVQILKGKAQEYLKRT